jgi:hypothetical protein
MLGSFAPAQDVPVLHVTLPPNPRPWDTDAGALLTALQSSSGMAIVGFKSPSTRRTLEASGVHAAASSADIARGLMLADSLGVTVLKFYQSIGAAAVHISPAAALVLRNDSRVDYVEPLGPSTPMVGGGGLKPMPSAARAWASWQGQMTPWGVSMVGAPQVWPTTTGGGFVIEEVGVGIGSHADLASIPSYNCVGYFAQCSPNSWGTGVAGATMALNNSIGVVGVAPGIAGANVISWAACDTTFSCYWPISTTDAINAAPSYQAKVLALNYAFNQYNQGEATAVARALTYDIVVVAPKGDYVSNSPAYPADYDSVVAVSGVGPDTMFFSAHSDSICSAYSNYGNSVKLSAPFWGVTTWGSGYSYACSSLMAASYVVGAVALVRSAHPSWSHVQVMTALYSTALDRGAPGWDAYYGNGVVNAAGAVSYQPPSLSVSISGPKRVKPNANCGWWANPTGGTPPYSYTWIPAGSSGPDPNEVIESWSGLGTVYLTVWAYDALNHQAMAKDTITVISSAPVCYY